MHIELLSEDKSGSVVLENIMRKYLQNHTIKHSCHVRPHRGKGHYPDDFLRPPAKFASGLMDLLPAKVRAYSEVYKPSELLMVIVMDSDDEPFDKVYSSLERIVRKFGNSLPYVIGIAVEEMESWLLGDRQAVAQAYPEAHISVIDDYKQDSICGTWEVLATTIYGNSADRIIKIGYPAIGQYKYEWAENISSYMEIERNQSPSFKRFIRQLDRILLHQENLLRYRSHG